MNFFSKLFAKQEDRLVENITPTVNFPMAQTEEQLIEMYCGLGLEKQVDVPIVTQNQSWNFKMDTGTISFGSLVFPVQILGSISHSSQTWLWAWANDKSGIPDHLKQQAFELKEYGEKSGIDMLQSAQFDADINDVHKIGCIASGMFQSSCYYIADYGQGAMLVTIKDTVFEEVEKNEHLRIITTFPQLISIFDMNHQNAFRFYLMAKGYIVEEAIHTTRANKNGNSVLAHFDELGRMTNLESGV